MANLKLFVSFEFDKDNDLKANFFRQANENSPHRVLNCSLNSAYPNELWKAKAKAAISKSDMVVVLVGQDTHNAPGVKTEVAIARQLGKPTLQVVPTRRPYRGLPDLHAPVKWRWKRINAEIAKLWDELSSP